MMNIIIEAMNKVNIIWEHLDSTWDWMETRTLIGIEFTKLRNIHDIEFFRTDGGIYVHWKQWMTDETWSAPVLLVVAENISRVGQARPAMIPNEFPEGERPKMKAFLDRLQMQQETAGTRAQRQGDFQWLYNVVDQEERSLKKDISLEQIVADLRLAGQSAARRASTGSSDSFPSDILVQLFPGHDAPSLPVDSLLRIQGAAGRTTANDSSGPCLEGSLIITRGRKSLPFHLGAIVAVLGAKAMVQWWQPGQSREANMRAGRKK
jgi:hypothetical protein